MIGNGPVPAAGFAADDMLRSLIRAVNVRSTDDAEFAGVPVGALPALGFPPGSGLASLAQALYVYAYCAGVWTAPLPTLPGADPNPAFLVALGAANVGRARWDPGWRVAALGPGGEAVLHKDQVSHRAWPGEYWIVAPPGTAPHISAAAALSCPVGSAAQPGFWFAFGETPADTLADARRIRIYWHIRPHAAPLLVEQLTRALNRFQLPFQLKCLAAPAHYWRRDSLAILYLSARYYALAHALLAEIHPAVAAHLAPEVPLFTRQLAPGVALAEDPGGVESFGQTRCRLVAEGLYNALARGRTSEEDRLEAVHIAFARAGIDLADPHRNSGSTADYPPLAAQSLC